MRGEVCAVSYNNIRISRERNGFEVRCTDPAIQKQNDARDSATGDAPRAPWKDPEVEFKFDTKEQVLKFVDSAMDIALPTDEFTSAFDKLAKEALKS